jgi:hypothetical protein
MYDLDSIERHSLPGVVDDGSEALARAERVIEEIKREIEKASPLNIRAARGTLIDLPKVRSVIRAKEPMDRVEELLELLVDKVVCENLLFALWHTEETLRNAASICGLNSSFNGRVIWVGETYHYRARVNDRKALCGLRFPDDKLLEYAEVLTLAGPKSNCDKCLDNIDEMSSEPFHLIAGGNALHGVREKVIDLFLPSLREQVLNGATYQDLAISSRDISHEIFAEAVKEIMPLIVPSNRFGYLFHPAHLSNFGPERGESKMLKELNRMICSVDRKAIERSFDDHDLGDIIEDVIGRLSKDNGLALQMEFALRVTKRIWPRAAKKLRKALIDRPFHTTAEEDAFLILSDEAL